MPIPHLFRCPISLELYTDPVTLCTGQTYDRPCIEKWISSGNLTCPVTMLRLHDLSMVPNRTLSHLIRQWIDQTARSLAFLDADHEHDDYLAALKRILESQEPIWEEKLQALKQVKALSLGLPGGENESLIQFGFFPLLLEQVFVGSPQNMELVELALSTALKLMPFSDVGCLNMLKEEAKMASLSALLEEGTSLIKISLCHLLEAVLSQSCSSCQQLKELSALIGNSGEIQRLMVNLIMLLGDGGDDDDDDDDNEEVSEAGVKAMLALCSSCASNPNQSRKALEKLVQLGGVNSLAKYILRALKMEQGQGSAAAAVAALEVLLEAEGGKEALLTEKNGVKAVVEMVFRVCDHQGSESAVNCLMGLCRGSEEAREEAVKGGVLTQLLLLLQSQCPAKAKTRARLLLKLLRNTWAKDPFPTARNHLVG